MERLAPVLGGAGVARVLSVHGQLTRVESFEEDGSAGSPAIVIVPGNPGVVDFYAPFAYSLHRRTRLPVHVVSHRGHFPEHPRPADYTFDEQRAHKRSLFHALHAGGGACRLVASSRAGDDGGALVRGVESFILVGHSIGAFLCLDVMRSILPPTAVKQAVLLTPTLQHIGATPNGRKLMPLFRFLRFPPALAALALSLLPAAVLHALARVAAGPAPGAALGLRALASFRVVHSALFMAVHEMRAVQQPHSDVLRASGSKIRAVFADNDQWVPTEHRKSFQALCPKAHVASVAGVEHAFVLHDSEPIVGQCAKWIDAALPARRQPGPR